jgi:hypothetical protein
MAMSELKMDQVVAMTKEQLLAADARDVCCLLQDMAFVGEHKADFERIQTMFAGPVEYWVNRIRQAYDNKEEGVPALVAVFSKEPGLIQILTWQRVTNIGIDEISYAKFIHKHFATPILRLFGTPGV